MKTIEICGKTLNLAFNMATLMAYEMMTDKSALEPSQFFDEDNKPRMQTTMQLGYAMLTSCNDEADVPDINTVMRSLDSLEKISQFVVTVINLYLEEIMPKKGEQKQEDSEKEDPKNA